MTNSESNRKKMQKEIQEKCNVSASQFMVHVLL